MAWVDDNDEKTEETSNLDRQLIDTMNLLDIPEKLQDTIMSLGVQEKESMLELYKRQTRLISKPKPPSYDPLDSQLMDRMNALYVPKHIQSQIITLPPQKKKILLAKYKAAPSPSSKNKKRHASHSHHRTMTHITTTRHSNLTDNTVDDTTTTARSDTAVLLDEAIGINLPEDISNINKKRIGLRNEPTGSTSMMVQHNKRNNHRISMEPRKSNIILPSGFGDLEPFQKEEVIEKLSKNNTKLLLNFSNSQSDLLLDDIEDDNEEKLSRCYNKSNGKLTEPDLSEIMDQIDLDSHLAPYSRTRFVDNNSKSVTHKKNKTANDISSILDPPGSSLASNYFPTQQEEQDIYLKCLRCLRQVSIKSDITNCRFHAFSSQGPDYEDVDYFIRRNQELSKLKDFTLACCNKRCLGQFENFESQQNGCHIKEKHLFRFMNIKNVPQSVRQDSEDTVTGTMVVNEEAKHDTDEQIEGGAQTQTSDLSASLMNELQNKPRGNEHVHVVGLCGKWKMFVYVDNESSLYMICDVDIIKHTKHGQIEGVLMSTTYVQENRYENKYELNERIYFGQLKDNQLILTYHGKEKYTASYLLGVEEYRLNGQWIASTHQKGTCQWYKIQKLL